jgi:hypothetical protein
MHMATAYIPSIRPAQAEDYARVCVHGVRKDGKRREIVDDSAAHVWCVYGAVKDSTAVECFGEFASKAEAWTYVLELVLILHCPIWDCAKGEA